MATRMQQRRGTAAQWISTNSSNGPILSAGEIGFESDTNKFKIGDGVNHWVDLTYFTDADSILSAVSGLVDGAPALLNTLNELAAALGDDPNFLSSYATTSYVDTAIGNVDALPTQADNSGKFLTTNGTAASWATVDLSAKQDKVTGVSDTEIGYLDGVTSAIQTQLDDKASTSYVDTEISNIDALPSQSGNAGKVLKTNGTSASWMGPISIGNPVDITGFINIFIGTEVPSGMN